MLNSKNMKFVLFATHNPDWKTNFLSGIFLVQIASLIVKYKSTLKVDS